MTLTPANFDEFLDKGELTVQTIKDKWIKIKRNGKTRRWVRDPARIEWPCKYGFNGTITVTPRWIEEGWVRCDD